MKQLWSKYSKLLLVMLLITSMILTGCSEKGSTTDEEPAAEATATEATAENQEEVTAEEAITLKFFDWHNSESDYNAQFAEMFEAENPGVTVEIEYVEGGKADDYMKKLDLLLLAGDDTDVIKAKSIAEYAKRAKNGLFEPLDPYFEQEGISFDDIFTINTRVDGVVYGLPEDTNASYVFLNKDALDEAGLPVPDVNWTWDDFREYAKALTSGEGEDKVYGSFMPTWGDPVHSYIVMNQTKEDNPFFYDEDTHALGDEKLKEWLEFRYMLENEDETQVPYYEISTMNLGYKDYFYGGKANMLPVYGPFIFGSARDLETYPHDFKVSIAPLPAWKDGPKGWTRTDSGINAVNPNSKNKEMAFKFILSMGQDMSEGCSKIRPIKNVDTTKVAAMLTAGAEDYFDIESIENVFSSDLFLNIATIIPEEQEEIKTIFKEEQEEYLVGGQTIEECVEDMVNRADVVMNK